MLLLIYLPHEPSNSDIDRKVPIANQEKLNHLLKRGQTIADLAGSEETKSLRLADALQANLPTTNAVRRAHPGTALRARTRKCLGLALSYPRPTMEQQSPLRVLLPPAARIISSNH